MGFFKSFFSGKPANPEEEKQKNNQKNFEIFKYDGMRAQRMGRADYAIKCFTEALALQEDFETMGYLAQVYIQSNELDEARKLLERMIRTEPEHTSTLLTLANVCYMQEDYAAMAEAAKKAIAIEEGNAMAHYLLGKADNGQNDGIMCIAHLTKAIVLKDDFTEARLLRAEALTKMHGAEAEAEADYLHITELNPFNEQAFLYLGQLYIVQKKLTEAIALFDEAIELNPDFAQAYHERGRAKLLNGDKEGSMEDMKRGLELNPKELLDFNGQYGNLPGNNTTNVLGL